MGGQPGKENTDSGQLILVAYLANNFFYIAINQIAECVKGMCANVSIMFQVVQCAS